MNHFYETIPGFFDFENIYKQMVEGYPSGSHFVEIGCWRGRSAAYMGVEIVNSGKNIQFACVDSWKFTDDNYADDLFPEKDLKLHMNGLKQRVNERKKEHSIGIT